MICILITIGFECPRVQSDMCIWWVGLLIHRHQLAFTFNSAAARTAASSKERRGEMLLKYYYGLFIQPNRLRVIMCSRAVLEFGCCCCCVNKQCWHPRNPFCQPQRRRGTNAGEERAKTIKYANVFIGTRGRVCVTRIRTSFLSRRRRHNHPWDCPVH